MAGNERSISRMSEIIKYLVGIAIIVGTAGQLPRVTVFVAKEFARVQQKGLGSLTKLTEALTRK